MAGHRCLSGAGPAAAALGRLLGSCGLGAPPAGWLRRGTAWRSVGRARLGGWSELPCGSRGWWAPTRALRWAEAPSGAGHRAVRRTRTRGDARAAKRGGHGRGPRSHLCALDHGTVADPATDGRPSGGRLAFEPAASRPGLLTPGLRGQPDQPGSVRRGGQRQPSGRPYRLRRYNQIVVAALPRPVGALALPVTTAPGPAVPGPTAATR